MIQFKIARLPNPSLSASSSTATSEENARRVLDSLERQPTYFLPSNLQNPRFEVAKGGRSAWVICWKSAVNMLAAKGLFLIPWNQETSH